MLTTQSDLSFVSPLAGLAHGLVGSEAAQLTDWSGRLVLDIRGRDRPAALRDVVTPEAVGEVARVENGMWARLRADRWFYVADTAGGSVEPSGGQYVTDVTHAYGILSLRGARAPDVLSHLCGLDFSDQGFPDHRAAQTSLAKVPALIVRADGDERGYLILVERSVAVYVWTILSDVASSAGAVAR